MGWGWGWGCTQGPSPVPYSPQLVGRPCPKSELGHGILALLILTRTLPSFVAARPVPYSPRLASSVGGCGGPVRTPPCGPSRVRCDPIRHVPPPGAALSADASSLVSGASCASLDVGCEHEEHPFLRRRDPEAGPPRIGADFHRRFIFLKNFPKKKTKKLPTHKSVFGGWAGVREPKAFIHFPKTKLPTHKVFLVGGLGSGNLKHLSQAFHWICQRKWLEKKTQTQTAHEQAISHLEQ